jgi:Kyakuja-Dileera-Zisupton transposase
MFAMDGNDSAKRMANSFRRDADTRVFDSNYFVPVSEADEWDLVRLRSRVPVQAPVVDEPEKGPAVPVEDDGWETDNEGDDKEAVSSNAAGTYVKNWKAAQKDSKKRSLGIFDETGWFASGCRHGMILWVVDMIQSGELWVHPPLVMEL